MWCCGLCDVDWGEDPNIGMVHWCLVGLGRMVGSDEIGNGM